ncbi:MAG: hypothetical protein COA66_09170 [Arcobacter sp.]|nr:MAG: hypothetical protein COA66_09170 [Arcobacter sp.]
MLSINEFIDAYQYGKFATPLDIDFWGRKEDKSNIISLIESNNITLATGKSGVGKTKLVLESIKDFANSSNYEPICIFNRGINTLEDIQSFFSTDSKYLIFIDDANRMNTTLDYIISLYPEKIKNGTLKIILTVRDYAKEKILNFVNDRTFTCEEYIINELKKEDIHKIIKNDFNINNIHYIDRIEHLSKGNPRLAIMMAKVINETNDLSSLNDIFNIYNQYFASLDNEVKIFQDNEMLKVIAIVSFFRNVDKTNEVQVNQIEEVFDINIDKFWEKVIILNKLEIFDLYENEVVKVSDQILSTFLFYKVVFIDEVIDVDTFMSNFFHISNQKLNDAIVPILNNFDYNLVLKKLKISFDILKKKYEFDNQRKHELIKIFWYLDRTNNLIYLKDLIDNLTDDEITKINEEPSRKYTDDYILELIQIFSNDNENFREVIDLLFRYFDKNDCIYTEVSKIIKEDFGFNQNSHRENYEIQGYLFELISERLHTEKKEIYLKLIFELMRYYLLTEFDSTKSNGNTVTFHTFKLVENDHLKKFRIKIWNKLFNLQNENYNEVMKIILDYKFGFKIKTTKIENWDKDILTEFISKKFTNANYIEGKIVLMLCSLWKKKKIDFDFSLISKYTNRYTEVEKIMFLEYIDYRKENKNLSVEESDELIRHELDNYVKDFKIEDYEDLFNKLIEINELNLNNEHRLANNLSHIIERLSKTNANLFIEVVDLIFSDNYILKFHVSNITKGLLYVLGKQETFEKISMLANSLRYKFLFSFYICLDESIVVNDDINNLILLYDECNEPLDIPDQLDFLLKYLIIDESLLLIISKTLYLKSKKNIEFLNGLYLLFNSHTLLNKSILNHFSSDIELLKKIYLSLDNYQSHFDYDAHTLNEILNADNAFIIEYLEYDKGNLKKNKEFEVLWHRDDYNQVITDVVETMYKKKYRYISEIRLFFNFKKRNDDYLEISQKQKDFLKNLIEKNIEENEKIAYIFSQLISDLKEENKKEFLDIFLTLNNNINDFKQISLEPSHMSWQGSAVPMYKKRLDFLVSILDLLKGVDYLEHKKYIEDKIELKKRAISEEKKRDFLTDF